MNASTGFRITASPTFPGWLESQNCSLAFSTYQLGKLFFVGRGQPGRLSVFERTFNRCLGLWANEDSLWLASAYQLWRLENVLESGASTDDGYDRLYVPSEAYTTGDVDAHDLIVNDQGEVIFVNTLFCCLSTVSERYSFKPIWQPKWIDKLAAEDRCHLNGLAAENGRARYATACSQTNTRHGWRECRDNGGCVIDIDSCEVIVSEMSMPHSPRIYKDRLWVHNSGKGFFGYVDLQAGKFEPVAFCPGYARGLAFVDKYAVIGLSRPREKTFSGLQLDSELASRNAEPGCGLMVVDIESGKLTEWMNIQGNVDELYDVLVLPGARRPKALGLKTDEIRTNVWFEDEATGKVSRWTAGEQ